MFTWLVRGLLVLGGTVASWFVATDAPNFSVVKGVAKMLLDRPRRGRSGVLATALVVRSNRAPQH
jgi:hypothetical protein